MASRYTCFLLLVLICTSIVINCTPPPLGNEYNNKFLEKLTAPKKLQYLQSGGSVEISIDGHFYSGSADIQSWADSLFKIDVYSTFGSSVMNLKYNTTGASVIFQDSSFFIAKSGCMEALPYQWAKLITVDQFVHLLRSNFDKLSSFIHTVPQKREDKRFIRLIWEDSVISVQQIIHKRSGKTVSLIIRPDKNSNSEIRMSEFSDFFAHKFKFIDDNKNYFSINYENIKLRNDQ